MLSFFSFFLDPARVDSYGPDLSGRQGERNMPGEGCIRLRMGSGLEEGKALAVSTAAWHMSGHAAKWKRAVW